ncbi:MAG: hypothetical protein Q9227_002245 [Pyrenula ochraceoflavens]
MCHPPKRRKTAQPLDVPVNIEPESLTSDPLLTAASPTKNAASNIRNENSELGPFGRPRLHPEASANYNEKFLGHEADEEMIYRGQRVSTCFGMLCDITVSPLTDKIPEDELLKLIWDGTSLLNDSKTGAALFELPTRYLRVFQTLCKKGGAALEMVVSRSRKVDDFSQHFMNHVDHELANLFSLSANVYGPTASGRAIGAFLQQCQLYLQNPEHCGRDVPYLNPHCLTNVDGKEVMTSIFNKSKSDITNTHLNGEFDVFADFGHEEELEQSAQPHLITTMLHKYQNMISQITQADTPKPFRGGIQADEMGLGKTLSMLALIASIWENEIKRHMSSTIQALVYYGLERQRGVERFNQYDLVITTYNVVASEWKEHRRAMRQQLQSCKLHSFLWHRIVLDEDRAKNSVINVYPYDDSKTFEKEIIRPWRNQIDQKPLQKLQFLMRMITIHRSKSVINLPSRSEYLQEVPFTAEEKDLYEQTREGTIQELDHAISSGRPEGSIYLSMLKKISRLRFICNHGVRHRAPSLQSVEPRHSEANTNNIAVELDQMFENLDGACIKCGTDIEEERETSTLKLSPQCVSQGSETSRLCISCTSSDNIAPDASTGDLPTPTPSLESFKSCEDHFVNMPSKIKAVVCYLQEKPQWNPMVEEQAIARIYRLRQTKSVHVARFVIKDTWEQRMITKQERKRMLADLVLSRSHIREGSNGTKQLWVSPISTYIS